MKTKLIFFMVALFIIGGLLNTYACMDISDSDDWDISDWDDYVSSGDAEDQGITGTVWSDADDFIQNVDFDALSDVLESLDELGIDNEEITSLINDEIIDRLDNYELTTNSPAEYVLVQGAVDYHFDCNCFRADTWYELKDVPGNEDVNNNGIKDGTEDRDHNGINDFLQDTDGDGIVDMNDDDPDCEWWSSCDESGGASVNGISDQILDDEQNADEDLARAIDLNTPKDPIDNHIYTDQEKQQILNGLIQELELYFTVRDGSDFVSFPPTSNNLDEVKMSFAIYETGNIYVSNRFFNNSENFQKSALVHEWTHYKNDLENKYPVVFDDKGNIINGRVSFTWTTASYPDDIVNRLEVSERRSYNEDISNGTNYNMTFEVYWAAYEKTYVDQKTNTELVYRPSNLIRDEIDCYREQIKYHQEGVFPLSEDELLQIEINLIKMENLLPHIIRYETENNIKPTGEGFVKP